MAIVVEVSIASGVKEVAGIVARWVLWKLFSVRHHISGGRLYT